MSHQVAAEALNPCTRSARRVAFGLPQRNVCSPTMAMILKLQGAADQVAVQRHRAVDGRAVAGHQQVETEAAGDGEAEAGVRGGIGYAGGREQLDQRTLPRAD